MMKRSVATFALLCVFAWTMAVDAGNKSATSDTDLSAAMLAVEEAELRERMITALAVAEGLRLRGRTILIAMSEIERVRRTLRDVSPLDAERSRLGARLEVLEERRRKVSALVDQEFKAYLEIVGEIADDLWPRLRRVGGDLDADLESRRLDQLRELLPMLRAHAEQLNRQGSLSQTDAQEWRQAIDDTYELREDKLRQRNERELPPLEDSEPKEEEV